MLEQKRGKEGVWDTDEREHNEGKGQGRGGEEEEEAVRGWYSRILSTCSEAKQKEGWATGRFGN